MPANGDRQARMYVKFDTGSAGYFHFSYADSGDAPPPLWFIDSLRWADGYASAIGWTNRNRVNSYFRGTIPRFEIQGTGYRRHARSNAPSATTGSSAASC